MAHKKEKRKKKKKEKKGIRAFCFQWILKIRRGRTSHFSVWKKWKWKTGPKLAELSGQDLCLKKNQSRRLAQNWPNFLRLFHHLVAHSWSISGKCICQYIYTVYRQYLAFLIVNWPKTCPFGIGWSEYRIWRFKVRKPGQNLVSFLKIHFWVEIDKFHYKNWWSEISQFTAKHFQPVICQSWTS